ncbi:MAG: purine-nucleoside phosphorylase [Tannerellaceae bacterium]|nr:purine-nucleoside phosphorylase [Tannerellaceae bacterium]
MSTLIKEIERAYSYVYSKVKAEPRIGIILGSGLGDFLARLNNTTRIAFSDIPCLPLTTVDGHDGALVFGSFNDVSIVVMQGRLHYYEGYSQSEITIPVRLMKKLGVKTLIITNAAGGINLDLSVGSLMLISDHINYSGSDPLIGENLDEFGPRFPDVSDVYSKKLRTEVKRRALDEGIALSEGVYIMYSGPNYETPAEIRFFRTIGADAVGMSTVPEALVAAHCGIKVIGISCITNMAAGILDKELRHEEVLQTAGSVKSNFVKLVCLAIDVAKDH